MDPILVLSILGIAAILAFAIAFAVSAFTANIKVNATLKARLQDPIFKEKVDVIKSLRKEEEALANELAQDLSWLERLAYESGSASTSESLIQKLIDS